MSKESSYVSPTKEKETKKEKHKNVSIEKLLRTLLKEIDNPDWFKGLSQFQLQAADSLQHSIRDDLEQETTHRVHDALIRLGVEPLVSTRKIWAAMRLSRGNDIAFLWFLMELYYRHDCDKCDHVTYSKYSTSEQLIMSTIAHLDMIPTLRELNRVLPVQTPKPKPKKTPRKKKKKRTYLLPYFEKQHTPVSYGKKLTSKEGANVANLQEYNQYLNPNYTAPNEVNRWYAGYTLHPSERIVKATIEQIIKDIFKKEDTGTMASFQKKPVFCAHHTVLMALNENKTTEKTLHKRMVCVKNFEVDKCKKKIACKRFEKQLNLEVAEVKEDFKKSATLNYGVSGPCRDSKEVDSDANSRRIKMVCISKQATYDENFNKYDYGHSLGSTKNIYFEAPSYHKPYKFNYDKIFDLGAKNTIKEAVNTALTGGTGNTTLDHKDAVRKYCKQVWTEQVKQYKKDSAQKRREMKMKQNLSSNKDKFTYYDPFNAKLMSTMLKNALDEIKQDRRFVLASMPDAHKVPMLRAWIKKRYGYYYSRKERKASIARTRLLFQTLNKYGIHSRIPQIYDLAKQHFVTYSCREYLLKKGEHFKDKYFHNFKVCFLDQSRIYWSIVRPFQCSGGPPRKQFFAYLPSRGNDIHMFRIWRPDEYMRAHREWNRRQKIKLMAQKY